MNFTFGSGFGMNQLIVVVKVKCTLVQVLSSVQAVRPVRGVEV